MKRVKKKQKQLQEEAQTFKDEVMTLRKRVANLENSKLALIEECNQQLNFLRTGIRIMNGQK